MWQAKFVLLPRVGVTPLVYKVLPHLVATYEYARQVKQRNWTELQRPNSAWVDICMQRASKWIHTPCHPVASSPCSNLRITWYTLTWGI